MTADHYRTLDVAPDATTGELRAAYLKLARTYHPDTFEGGERRAAEAKMQLINEAWNVLGTPHRRAEYDRSRPVADATAGAASQTRGHAHFRPFDVDDPWTMADIDLDPTPIAGSRGIPRWVSFMPVLFVASGLVSFGFGMLIRAGEILAFGAIVFMLGLVGFLMLPLWVMSRAERDPKL